MMKAVLAASLGLATLASATNYPRQPRFNYRRTNESTAAAEELTTLTVLSTSMRTVLSCAPTVTDCPANSAALTKLASSAPEQIHTHVVTDVIQLATTICPVTAAQAVSSSVYSVAATGGITGVTLVATPTGAGGAPYPTGYAAGNATAPAVTSMPALSSVSPEAATASDDECEAETSTVVSTSVATLSTAVPVTVTVTKAGVGSGSKPSVELSTSTSYSTYVTSIPVTKTVINTASPEETEGSSPEQTTISGTSTTTAYSTGTKTQTLTSKVASATGESSPVDTAGNSVVSSGSGSEPEACEAKTVTVTAPASTVYVTVGAGATSSSVPLAANVATSSSTVAAAATSPSSATSPSAGEGGEGDDDTCDDAGEGDEGDDDTCDDDGEGDDDDSCPPEETVTATVVPASPTGSNSTGSAFPTGAALKNRFAKLH